MKQSPLPSGVINIGGGTDDGPIVIPPPGGGILISLRKCHPRLLVDQDTFILLKQRLQDDAQLKLWHGKLLVRAQDLLAAPPSRYDLPASRYLLRTSRQVLDRIYLLALMFHLEGDPRYAERAWQELKAAADFPDWNPGHFLDTAEMTHALAIGYDWLYRVWNAEQRGLLERALVDKGLRPALLQHRTSARWTKARNNWNQVCNGGIAMGALALGEIESDLAAGILEASLQSVKIAMAEFAPDGAWKEGPGYWNYATFYSVVFLAALESALGSELGLSQIPGFPETGMFPIYMNGPFDRTFNYADASDQTIRAPQMFCFARKYSQPLYAWYQRQAGTPSALDLLWYEPAGSGPKSAVLPLDKYFRNAEVVTFRSSWEDPQAVFTGFKAGDSKASHGHLDLGSFVFDALGVRWFIDLGADDYSLPGYFRTRRWDYYRLRAEGHNTLVFNPSAAPDQTPDAETRVMRFQSTPEWSCAIADLTPAYAGHARKVLRGLALMNRERVLVQDEIECDKPAEVWWFTHTGAEVSIENGGRRARLAQGGKYLDVEILSPASAAFEILEARPISCSPQPENQAKNNGTRKLAIHLRDVSASVIAVLLSPVRSDERGPLRPFKVSSLSEW
jgi:hypothetical protein